MSALVKLKHFTMVIGPYQELPGDEKLVQLRYLGCKVLKIKTPEFKPLEPPKVKQPMALEHGRDIEEEVRVTGWTEQTIYAA